MEKKGSGLAKWMVVVYKKKNPQHPPPSVLGSAVERSDDVLCPVYDVKSLHIPLPPVLESVKSEPNSEN